MTDVAKEQLRNTPRAKCAICGTKRNYTNPMAKCWECQKKYCFDHIFCGQVKVGMKETEEVRDICDNCRDKCGYRSM